uniref:HTH CENPB-type domain-containing protein n=1 Tax=Strongyloides stercoralis TaxID=6248 RepID=A0A0K0DZW9_STRER
MLPTNSKVIEKSSDSDFDGEPVPDKRRSFDLNFKLMAVNYAEKNNNSKAARHFKVNRRQIQKWRNQKVEIESQLKLSNNFFTNKRVHGAGRPLKDIDFDEKMINWIREQRNKKLRVSRKLIQQQALSFSTGNLKASDGWLQKFMIRHGLSLRRPTTVCQKEPDQYKEKIVDYILFVEYQRRKSNYQYIFAADETAVYIDFSNSLTVEKRGTREIPVKSTGHDKFHITVMLTARSDGYKCRPFVLLPRVRSDKLIEDKFRGKLQLCWAGQTFFNDATNSEYLQRILGPSLFGKRMLAWDSYRCHISENTKKKLKELQIDSVVIPGGCTKFIQAADIYWNAPFKAKIRQFYEDWIVHGEKSYTKSENMKRPSMNIYLQWIVDAWEELSRELIIKSFKGCGLTNALDGSDDKEIHCFKPNGLIPSGCFLLEQARINGVNNKFEQIQILEEEEGNDYDNDEYVEFD